MLFFEQSLLFNSKPNKIKLYTKICSNKILNNTILLDKTSFFDQHITQTSKVFIIKQKKYQYFQQNKKKRSN
ncbi:hypothetical protein EV201_0218 [Ancylomarina subtilis]|uniref:Uncharacterized protein n=1 Tax=Ancylomarina subtilis TaxID=1639035 RepID=A0A4V2FSU3_9BACT|nr:hypothetical protein EV201_0218 [Ancylomarina subtilis]